MPISLILEYPLVGVAWVAAILVALSFHEFAHALVSTRLGDATARDAGRLTVHPFAHVDPLGFLMLLFVGFGWGKPVPFDPAQLRSRRWGPVAVALAGPAMNALGFVVSVGVLRALDAFTALPPNNLLVLFVAFALQVNLVLLIFNLIPIPPLDGSKLLLAALDRPRYASARALLESRGPIILLALVIVDSILGGAILGRALGAIMDGITGLL